MMGVIGDLKFIVGLGAIGAIGYGAYKIVKKVPDIQKGVEDVFNDIQEDFNKIVEDVQDNFSPDKIIEDIQEKPEETLIGTITPWFVPEPVIEQAIDTAGEIKDTVVDWYVGETSITYEDTQNNPTIQHRIGTSGGKTVKSSPSSNIGKGRK